MKVASKFSLLIAEILKSAKKSKGACWDFRWIGGCELLMNETQNLPLLLIITLGFPDLGVSSADLSSLLLCEFCSPSFLDEKGLFFFQNISNPPIAAAAVTKSPSPRPPSANSVLSSKSSRGGSSMNSVYSKYKSPLKFCTKIIFTQRDAHPTLLAALESVADQVEETGNFLLP